jgi:hypothetical protein
MDKTDNRDTEGVPRYLEIATFGPSSLEFKYTWLIHYGSWPICMLQGSCISLFHSVGGSKVGKLPFEDVENLILCAFEI